MKKYFYNSKNKLIAILVFLLFVACQSSTSVERFSPYPEALEDFKLDYFYGKFVGSNRVAFSENTDGSKLWNNCLDFQQPTTGFVQHEWRSTVYRYKTSDTTSVRDVYFPTNSKNQVANAYFILRYDITDKSHDPKYDEKNPYASWVPTTDGNIINNIKKTLDGFMENEKTVQGQTAFQIVYFRINENSLKQDSMEEVELNFGSTLGFEKTSDLPTDSTELRKKYEKIADALIEKTKYHLITYQEPYWSTYRRTGSDFDDDPIAEFKDNPETQTCPQAY